MALPGILSNVCGSFSACFGTLSWSSLPVSVDTLWLIGLYAALGGAYLVAVPLALYWWMVKRWTSMGKLERFGVYGLVFLFFPGLILFSPFINLRMAGQGQV